MPGCIAGLPCGDIVVSRRLGNDLRKLIPDPPEVFLANIGVRDLLCFLCDRWDDPELRAVEDQPVGCDALGAQPVVRIDSRVVEPARRLEEVGEDVGVMAAVTLSGVVTTQEVLQIAWASSAWPLRTTNSHVPVRVGLTSRPSIPAD